MVFLGAIYSFLCLKSEPTTLMGVKSVRANDRACLRLGMRVWSLRVGVFGLILGQWIIAGACRSAQAFEVIVQAAPVYSVLQTTNAAATGDSYFTGYGYQLGLRLRVPFVGVADRDFVKFSVFGSYSGTYGSNTADTSESGNATRLNFGGDLEIWRLLVGVCYQQTHLSVAYLGVGSTIDYGNLGVRAAFALPLSNYLSVYLGGQWTQGLAPGPTSSSGSKGTSETLGFIELQYQLFNFGAPSGRDLLRGSRI